MFLIPRQSFDHASIVAIALAMIRAISPILGENFRSKPATHPSPDFAPIALNQNTKSAHAGHRNHHLRVTL